MIKFKKIDAILKIDWMGMVAEVVTYGEYGQVKTKEEAENKLPNMLDASTTVDSTIKIKV